jgi:hypothetical protein
MVQVVLGRAEPPRPDDAADALAIAVWAANSVGSSGRAALSPVMDRAAVAPIARGRSGYERAVHEALARERAGARAPNRTAKRNASKHPDRALLPTLTHRMAHPPTPRASDARNAPQLVGPRTSSGIECRKWPRWTVVVAELRGLDAYVSHRTTQEVRLNRLHNDKAARCVHSMHAATRWCPSIGP